MVSSDESILTHEAGQDVDGSAVTAYVAQCNDRFHTVGLSVARYPVGVSHGSVSRGWGSQGSC